MELSTQPGIICCEVCQCPTFSEADGSRTTCTLCPLPITVKDNKPQAAGRKLCRHCGVNKVTRPRGLCWTCFYRPGVKEKYGPLSKFGRRGPGNVFKNKPLPATSTDAEPGTPRKLDVLAQRVANGEALWHPDDPRIPDPISTCDGVKRGRLLFRRGEARRASFIEAA